MGQRSSLALGARFFYKKDEKILLARKKRKEKKVEVVRNNRYARAGGVIRTAWSVGKEVYKHREAIKRLGSSFRKHRKQALVKDIRGIQSVPKKASKTMGKRMSNYRRSGSDSGRNPRFTSTKGKRKQSGRRKKKKLVLVTSKQVKKWNKGAKDAQIDLATSHQHERVQLSTNSVANSSKFANHTGFNITRLEQMIDDLVYINTSTSTATEEISNTLSIKQQFINCRVGSTATWYNNFGVPLWVDVYCYVPKVDTNLLPDIFFANGLVDVNASATSVFVYPSWSKELTKAWGIHSHKRVCLGPGESVHLGYKYHMPNYDPTFSDSHAFDYQKKSGAHTYAVRVEGCIGHDDTTELVGTSIAKIDWKIDFHVKTVYPGGFKGTRYKTVEPANSQSNGTVIGWPTNASNTKFNLST